jgi:beta-lysine 5,6-aminomutase alpha subunit
MKKQLNLSSSKITDCRKMAKKISAPVFDLIEKKSSWSIERTTLRLYGVDDALKKSGLDYPLCNQIIDDLRNSGFVEYGITIFWVYARFKNPKLTGNDLARQMVENPSKYFTQEAIDTYPKNSKLAEKETRDAINHLIKIRDDRYKLKKKLQDPANIKNRPMLYLIVATGNIYDDVEQAKSAARSGGDVIAVIRSTAQSLLDYIPHGATTEGFGGTYATQKNFQIMRQALDEVSLELGRYIRLVNYSSGLCMAEIAAMAAQERLDFLLNDAMYGILFRDINMQRTLVDQHFSRLIITLSDIYINTGEDNYLTTADAYENGHQVLASQFINECFAENAHMNKNRMGLGHAFEMNPKIPNVFHWELARALMTREIFPDHPLKYMPSTKYKSTDIFYSHLMDAVFNLIGRMTGQGIQLLGMATEAIHTPFMMDRYMSVVNAAYMFNGIGDFFDEVQLKKNGKIDKYAQKVLDDTHKLLKSMLKNGLYKSIEKGELAHVKRTFEGGKGFEGVFSKNKNYINLFSTILTKELPVMKKKLQAKEKVKK